VDEPVHLLFPARLSRVQYVVRVVLLDVCVWLLYTAWPSANPSTVWVRLLLICFGGLALAVYGLFFVLLPRVTDAGMSSWWIVVGLFPFIGPLFQLILLFIPTKRSYDVE
jgi:uncharacterized membrane protein YhaH (DUF805 family)